MQLIFDTIEEIEAFMDRLKKTRAKKGDDKDEGAQAGQAPAPLPPPTANAQPQTFAATATTGFPGQAGGFAPPAGGAAPAGAAQFAPAAPQLAPEVANLVQRISARIDAAIAGGQPPASALQWMQQECTKAGLNAAAADMNAIKTHFLPQLQVPHLTQIAQLMGA